MGFPRQEYWSGLPFPSPEDLTDSEVKPTSPELADEFFTYEPLVKPKMLNRGGKMVVKLPAYFERQFSCKYLF